MRILLVIVIIAPIVDISKQQGQETVYDADIVIAFRGIFVQTDDLFHLRLLSHTGRENDRHEIARIRLRQDLQPTFPSGVSLFPKNIAEHIFHLHGSQTGFACLPARNRSILFHAGLRRKTASLRLRRQIQLKIHQTV